MWAYVANYTIAGILLVAAVRGGTSIERRLKRRRSIAEASRQRAISDALSAEDRRWLSERGWRP